MWAECIPLISPSSGDIEGPMPSLLPEKGYFTLRMRIQHTVSHQGRVSNDDSS